MKPDWKDAPDWARWLARDGDGVWGWHEFTPEPSEFGGYWTSQGRKQFSAPAVSWYRSAESRPE